MFYFSKLFSSFFLIMLILLATGTSEATIIYSEDFSADPNYQTIGQRQGDIMEWDEASGSYHISFPTDDYNRPVWAMSSTFSTVTSNDSFTFSVDFMVNSMTWGHGMHIALGEGLSVPNNEPNFNLYSHYDGWQRVSDGTTNSYRYLPTTTNGTWYSFEINYDALSQSATISAWDRDAGVLLTELSDVAFLPTSFNQVFLGSYLQYGEGSTAEMYFDNIVIDVDDTNPVPEPATLFLFGTGLAGFAGYRRKMRKS